MEKERGVEYSCHNHKSYFITMNLYEVEIESPEHVFQYLFDALGKDSQLSMNDFEFVDDESDEWDIHSYDFLVKLDALPKFVAHEAQIKEVLTQYFKHDPRQLREDLLGLETILYSGEYLEEN
jgi:hypothetical protein